MKKLITATLLTLTLIAGLLPASQVLAAAKTDAQADQESAEQGLGEAIKTQVALSKARVSLLQARTKLWLEQNKEATLHSLDEARANLDEGWRSADQVTRARITSLKLQVDKTRELVKEKGQEAEVELQALSDRSESALNAVALEIDKSPERAQQALQDAENYLQQAKASASKATAEQVVQLQDKVQAAQQAVREKTNDAKTRVSDVVVSTEVHLQAYGKTIQESDEVKLLMKRYGQLEAQVALLNANLAAKTDATGKQAVAYLDESRAWYDSLKSQTSQRWDEELDDMSARIDEAEQAVERKDKQARAKLADLLERAAAMLKDEEPAK